MAISERKVDPLFLGQAGGPLDGRIIQNKFAQNHIFHKFCRRPVCVKVNGAGAATGTTGDTNLLLMPGGVWEYHIKGTQTIVAPVIGTLGLDVSMDQTAGDGVELTNGITALCPYAFVNGTDAAHYFRLKFNLADVSGATTTCMAMGWRKAEAYATLLTGYTEYAALNVNSGAIESQTRKASGTAVITDLASAWADAATHTLEVRISAGGAVTYYIDGVQNTAAPAVTLTAAVAMVPFFIFTQAADLMETLELIEWECGPLSNKQV